MTAQHAPHTPLWRRFLSLPHTRLGWWAVGLASPALAITVYSLVNQLLGGPEEQPLLLILAWLVSALVGGVAGLIAVERDRSLLVWVAQVPGLLIFAFFVWAAISMSGGGRGWYGEPDVRVTFPIAVLLWAIANLAVMWSPRNSGES